MITEKDLKLMIKELETFDEMIDVRCDIYGVGSTLDYLIEQGYTKEELLSMRFDEKDIDEAFVRAEEN